MVFRTGGTDGGSFVNGEYVPPKAPEEKPTPTIANPFGDGHTFLQNLLNERANIQNRANIPGYFSYSGNAPTQSGASGMFNQVFDQGLNGSTRSFDKAANRVRDRIDTQAGALKDQYTQQNLGGSQGGLRRGLSDIDLQSLGAYGDALVGLEKDFEDSRLAGLGIASGAASGVSQDAFNFGSLLNSYNKDRNQYNTDNRKITADSNLELERIAQGNLADILNAINANYGIESGIFKFLLEQ